VTPAELLELFQEFYRETLGLLKTRQVIAQSVAGYDANNAYQQVIGRQEEHLRWLSDAIAASNGTVGDDVSSESDSGAFRREEEKSSIESDVRRQRQFLDSWSPRVESVANARQRKMLQLILGEMKEHLRVLEQAAEGRNDLLGRHAEGKVMRGAVLPARPKS
jgi:hypothetical protein